MKKDILGIKISTVVAVVACLATAFLLWLYFNI